MNTILNRFYRFDSMKYNSKRIILLLFLFLNISLVYGQTVGDYRTNATGNWNWSTRTNWQRYNGTTWVTPSVAQGYPGYSAGAGAVTIRNSNGNTNITLDLPPANSIGSLTLEGGNRVTSLIMGTNSLSVTGAVTINAPTDNNESKYISLTTGSLTCGSIFMASTGGETSDCYININGTGSVTTGNITMNLPNTRNYILFSGAGTLNVSGTITDGGITSTAGGGAAAPTRGTVNYNNSGNQSIGAYTYFNLTVSGGGEKSLVGNTRVNNDLNLTSGIIKLGANNLTHIGTSAILGGPFSASNMIETDGDGFFDRQNATAPYTIPLGSNGAYSPVTVQSVTSSTSMRFRSVFNTTLGSQYLKRFWSIQNSVSATATLIFGYDAAENPQDPTSVWARATGGNWAMPTGTESFDAVGKTFTVTGTNISNTISEWTAGVTFDTYFSYQTGDWNKVTTWTSDPGGTTQVGTTLPGPGDVVVILPGRTVTLTADTATNGLEININEGGILNIADKLFTAGLYALKGAGTLQLTSTNFPSTSVNSFVQEGGGTTVYKNPTSFTLQNTQDTYNNLTIELTAGETATQLHNLTLNGNLHVKSGTFRINDNSATTKLNLSIAGDVTVNAGAGIAVGQGVTNGLIGSATDAGTAPFLNYYDQFHRVVISGNFTNNGTVNFTNLAQPLYAAFPPTTTGVTSGAATVYFMGTSNSTMLCNGETDFYNLVLSKGIDQTYKLTIQPSAYQNFRLFGANTRGVSAVTANPNLLKALWIQNGTLELKGTVVIPSLTEGTAAGAEYYIPANGALHISGSSVIVLNTADDAAEVNVAYNVTGTTGVSINGYQSMVVFGKLQMNAGYLSTRESAGLLYSNEAAGQFEINDGVIDAKQFRTDGSDIGAAYRQTGGTLILRGRFVRPVATASIADLKNTEITYSTRAVNGTDDQYGTFNLEYDENIFSMSGGVVRIFDASGTAGQQKIVDVASSLANSSVTGGTFEIMPQHGATGDASMLLLFCNESMYGNLTINNGVGCNSEVRIRQKPLRILNNFTITRGSFLTNGQNITIGGNFTISTDGSYNSTTTTTLNGSRKQTFTIDGTIDNRPNPIDPPKPGLTNLIIDRTTDSLKLAGTQASLVVQGTFDLNGGVFADGGKTVSIAGNITNSGIHSGTGKIQLNGTAIQTIGGNGSGIFCNLELNNSNAATAPVSLTANATVTGTVTFTTDKSLNIGSYNLILNSTASVSGAGTGNRYFQTNGDAGDGGLTYVYPSGAAFTFPVGAASTRHAAAEYTPATIGFTAEPTTLGRITVIPVGYEHPATTVNGQSLTYFWRVKSSGFAGVAANSVTHSFQYASSDVAGTESNYIPTLYNSSTYTWVNGTNANPPINIATNTFTDWTTPGDSRSYIDADYTAGDNAFGTPKVYYSLTSGLWSSNSTWTFNSSHTGAQAGSVPGSNDIVVIGNNHVVSLYNNAAYPLNTASVSCASLQIDAGSTLDIGNNSSSVFSMVVNSPLGNGTFRLTTTKARSWIDSDISTFIFPAGDFTDFEVNQGTEEFYTTTNDGGSLYILPQKASFGNMVLSPLGGASSGDNMVLPNVPSVIIYGDLSVNGTSRYSTIGISWNTNDAFYNNSTLYTTVEKTVQVKGDLNVNGGSFTFYDDDYPQHLIVDGDVNVAATNGANIIVWDRSYKYTPYHNGPTVTNTFAIGGSLNNNGVDNGNFDGVRLTVSNNRHYVDVTFQGSSDEFFTGTGNTYLRNLTINKGTSQTTTLTCDVGGSLTTPTDNWLTLQNGTFKYMREVDQDFTVSVNTPFTIPSTAGLFIDYTTGQDVLIANTNAGPGDNSDVLLEGKLTILNGSVYIGQTAGTTVKNNDIEYAGGGFSEIEIQGGRLTVNGQIRRNPSMVGGILKYTQTGGTVTINGQNATTDNAKFEVCNTGSVFNMSGGTLNIVRGGGGTTYGDLYLRPHTSSVTGGTIIFQPVNNITAAQETFTVDASCALYNFTVDGFDADDAARASLKVNPLVLNGNLTLSDGNSILTTNNLNVTVKGNLVNNGTVNSYVYGSNTTTFSGGTQQITGTSATNFNNLTINPVTSVTLNNGSNVLVNGNLTLSRGTLICGSWAVNLKGNLYNTAAYTDSQYGIIMNGTSAQTVEGLGSYSRLEINNNNGVSALSNISLSKNLALTNGLFNIGDNLLSLSQTSQIEGSDFSATKMIATNGAFSDQGVKKDFGIGASTFTYPIGVSGKYTKVDVSISTNTKVGSIRITNVNDNHPAVLDPNRVLQYYWSVQSVGIENFTGNIVFNYIAGDVLGNIANYDGARLNLNSWGYPGTVDNGNRTLTYNFDTPTDYLGDEYTAGEPEAFPSDIPVYKTIKNGVWNDPSIWEQTAGTTHELISSGPNGFIVIIDSTVTTDANFCKAYRTTLNGTFRSVEAYSGHNLGTVTGSGTLYLESQVIPAGKYTTFFDCSNTSTLEYGGTGSTYTLLADLYDQVPRLRFTGTGTRILPPKDLTICHLFEIDGPTVDNSVNNRKLTILDSMVLTSGAFISGTGANATVTFAGSKAQKIENFTGTDAFNNLEINNSNGLTLTNDIDVAGNLLLTSGLITATETNSLTITNPLVDCIIPEGGKTTSYVNGPLVKRLDEGIDNFLFPIGNATVAGNKLSLHFTETGTLDWTVTYINPSSLSNTLSGDLTAVNDVEYWNVKSSTGTTAGAHISIKWDPSSNLTPLMTENGVSDMRVAEHDGTKWVEIPSSYTTGSNVYNGSAKTTGKESIASGSSSNYTLACVNTTKPRIRLSAPLNSVCGDAGIPIVLSTSYPISGTYTVYFTKDLGSEQSINPTSFPALLPTDPLGGAYRLTRFIYNNSTLGAVDVTPVTAYQVPTTASAGIDISICGGTSATLDGNPPTVGNGLWEIITAMSGAGGTVTEPTNPDSPFNGTTGNSYFISWTISNGTCTSSDTVKVSFPLLPAQPLNFIASTSPVCQGAQNVVYTVPNDPLINTYNWSYTGAGASFSSTTNSVEIDFDIAAELGLQTVSVTATNGCGTSAPRSVNITILEVPVASFPIDDINLCDGDELQISITLSGGTSPYNISVYNGSVTEDLTNKTSPFLFTPDVLNKPVWTGPGVNNTYIYSIPTVESANGCSNSGSNTINVIVWKTPETGPQYHVPNTYGF